MNGECCCGSCSSAVIGLISNKYFFHVFFLFICDCGLIITSDILCIHVGESTEAGV